MMKTWKMSEIQLAINLYYAKVGMAKIATLFQVSEQSIGKLLKRYLPQNQVGQKPVKKEQKNGNKDLNHTLSLREAFFWLRNDGFPIKTKNFVQFFTPSSPVPLTREQFVLIFNRHRLSKGLPIAYVKEVTDGGY